MSKHILPSAYTLGWNILDTKRTVGGLLGYSSVNSIVSLNVPSSNGVPSGPKMTAFHTMMLFSDGAPLTPAGGSSCSLLKSLMRRRLAGVDICYRKPDCRDKGGRRDRGGRGRLSRMFHTRCHGGHPGKHQENRTSPAAAEHQTSSPLPGAPTLAEGYVITAKEKQVLPLRLGNLTCSPGRGVGALPATTLSSSRERRRILLYVCWDCMEYHTVIKD